MPTVKQPVGVSVVAVLLLIGSLSGLLWIITLFTSPVLYLLTARATSSMPLLVLLLLLNSVLSLICGAGLLAGHDWARRLYIGLTLVLIIVAIVNGFRLTMLAGIIQYIVFVIILRLPSSNEYFHRHED